MSDIAAGKKRSYSTTSVSSTECCPPSPPPTPDNTYYGPQLPPSRIEKIKSPVESLSTPQPVTRDKRRQSPQPAGEVTDVVGRRHAVFYQPEVVQRRVETDEKFVDASLFAVKPTTTADHSSSSPLSASRESDNTTPTQQVTQLPGTNSSTHVCQCATTLPHRDGVTYLPRPSEQPPPPPTSASTPPGTPPTLASTPPASVNQQNHRQQLPESAASTTQVSEPVASFLTLPSMLTEEQLYPAEKDSDNAELPSEAEIGGKSAEHDITLLTAAADIIEVRQVI